MSAATLARQAPSAGFKCTPHRQRYANLRGNGALQRAPRLLKAAGGARSRRANTCRVAAPTPQAAAGAPVIRNFDFLVLGSGIAGLSYALKVAEHGSVAVVTKAQAEEGCTQYAQGGVCAVLGKHDSVEAHVEDTMIAGDHLNSRRVVEVVCKEGPMRVMELVELGAEFTRKENGALHLTREGGHSHRRIVHAADVTGREIERALLAAAATKGNISFFEHHAAIDLVHTEVNGTKVCMGADVLDQQAMRIMRFMAPVTMLATGGAGQVYPNTTNPSVATGDGMAMAYRAKATVANMEFVQFHPTAFCASAATGKPSLGRTFLISEAVRGEGGRLYNLAGHRFMEDYDSRFDLAPRDIVARAIQDQMLSRGESHVLLDISYKPRDEILSHFPNIAAQCKSFGIDITREPIPVAPAQHYMCGGVQTGLSGETNVAGLFACGEVSCTGLHGANRLASNSLLEGLVFAERAVLPSLAHAEGMLRDAGQAMTKASQTPDFIGPRELSVPTKEWVVAKRAELTSLMWSAAGIVRRRADMKEALQQLAGMHVDVQAMWQSYGTSTELMELRNLTTVGELILMSALQRQESRGGHLVLDHPGPALGHPRTTRIGGGNLSASKPAPPQLVVGNKVPLKLSGAKKKSGGLIERARAREVALTSQKEDVE
ncbi:L-aspartate oxidase [Coccomyxa sp. Obi]|nr:L-aspartate oxidase [Coccomyxa sp. Obi]